jgi:hypothetical protein
MRGTNAGLESELDKVFQSLVKKDGICSCDGHETFAAIPEGDKGKLLADYYASL